MNIKRKLSLAVLTIAFAVSAIGCSGVPPAHASTTVSASATPEATSSASPEISAAAEASIPATKSKVDTIAAVPSTSPSAAAPVATVTDPVGTAPVEGSPEAPVVAAAPVAPVQAPAPVQVAPVQVEPAAPVQAAAPAVSREVYVGLAGGQSVVDLGRGPVLFLLADVSTPYVAEHDLLGGWERFGTLSAGMTVRMSGLVTGTYTVGQIINVPKHGTTAEFSKFKVMPKVMLQTCVPGTQRMIVVGLY